MVNGGVNGGNGAQQQQQQQEQQIQINVDEPIAVVLPIGLWNSNLQIISKAQCSWEVADPLIRAIRAQIGAAIQPRILKAQQEAAERRLAEPEA
jgi:hypothetical protein